MDLIKLTENAFKRDLSDPSALEDAFQAIRLLESVDFKAAHDKNKIVRGLSSRYAREQNSWRFFELNKKSLLFDAPHELDAAILYAEWDREPEKKFYLPRRKQLKRIVDAMQMLENREIRMLGVMAPPGSGKTTIALFFLIWSGFRNPQLSILGSSHNNDFLIGVYQEILRMLDGSGEYLWYDIFPDVRLVGTDAKRLRVDLGKRKRFETFEFSSIGSGNAGKVRSSNISYADDLVDGVESALSTDQMDKLWMKYNTDIRQRMIGDCVSLLIQTPWTLLDPIDRLEEMYADDPNAKFIHMPALDENDESNFDYPYGLGFTTEFYHKQRDMMDEGLWKALYMTRPIVREGLLYFREELRRYSSLPEGEPDAILAACDTKTTGKDFCAMPIAYQYGNDFYIEEFICDNSNLEIIEPRLISALVEHKVQMCRVESNSAGIEIAKTIDRGVKERGWVTDISTKYTTSNKDTKIIVNAPYCKSRFLFKEESLIKNNKDYQRALDFLCGYTMMGKNKHDDVPDVCAQLAEFIQSFEKGKVEVFRRPI